jgi:hypothetical protein
MIDMSYSRV